VQLPRIEDVTVDARLIAFTALVGILTTLAFALVPAIQASNADPGSALTRGGRGLAGGRQRLQRALVAAQVALAIVLLVGAGLLIRSFARLQQVSPGFDPEHVLTFRISASWSEPLAAVVGRQARTLARLERIPGVASAALSQTMPAGVDFPPSEFHIVGSDPANRTFADNRVVSAGYFKTMRIPMLQGDTCNTAPATLLPSQVLVTRAFADRFFPAESAIGHAITSPGLPLSQQVDIIGIVGDVREKGLGKAADPLIYWCGFSGYWPDPFYLVRFSDNRPASIADIRAAILEIEPTRAMYSMRPLTESLSTALTERRLSTILLTLFAATTVLLAAIGLYGVLSQLVAARRREIGVRMALGARAVHILASVGGQAAAIVIGGITIGLAGAFALARFMTTLVFGVSAHDPLTFAVVPVVLGVVAGTAALIPAARAAALDPMRALRDD
jgi:predicted permease